MIKLYDVESSDLVRARCEQGVAVVTWNRPDRRNAWIPALESAYFDVLELLEDDPQVRAIVVTGAGRDFCPGMDVAELATRTDRADPTTARSRPATYPLSVRKPLIAAISGACAGIGLLQALVCDIRFVAGGAKIATSFTRRGLVAELGVPWLLVRLVGQAHASDLLLSGRTITGANAAQIGLAFLADPDTDALTEAIRYARDLAANCSPTAMALVKSQLAAEWRRELSESATDAAGLVTLPEVRADFAEGVSSFRDKRPPHFAPLSRAARPAESSAKISAATSASARQPT